MSGTDPEDPLVLLPGGVMDAFIGSINQLAPADPVIIGGLAVMCRVGGLLIGAPLALRQQIRDVLVRSEEARQLRLRRGVVRRGGTLRRGPARP